MAGAPTEDPAYSIMPGRPRRIRADADATTVRAAVGRCPELVDETLLREYFPILIFLAIAGAVAVAMVAGSFCSPGSSPTPRSSPLTSAASSRSRMLASGLTCAIILSPSCS